MSLLPLKEAQERLLALAPDLGTHLLETAQASGGYLAEDLRAARTQPPADLSAMDGYAICGPGPWQRVGESRAGLPFEAALEQGQCTRISTGAHMPDDAEAVLIQENASVEGGSVALAKDETAPPAGRHVRKAGFDFAKGECVLRKGTRLGPAQIALAIAAGHDAVSVANRPSVAVLDSGDELAPDAARCGPFQIPASNGAMIASLLAPEAGPVERLGPVGDDMDALLAALDRADCHVLVTSGGASVGDHDLMQDALRRWGAEIGFWKVAIKPGKPLMVATRGSGEERQVILGLPGNPVSSFVTALLFALPLVRAASGAREPLPRKTRSIAAEALPATGSRHEFVRGIDGPDGVRLAGSQDSSALLALAQADCLIDRPPEAPAVSVGEELWVYRIGNG